MPVVVVADCDDVSTSVQVMKAGAADYLVSPVGPDRLLAALLRSIRIDEVRHRRHAASRELLDHYLELDDDEKAIWRQLQCALNDSPSLRNFDSATPAARTD